MQSFPRLFPLTAFAALAALVHLPGRAGESPATLGARAQAGSASVDTMRLDWRDDARGRAVPVKLYFPKAGSGPCPIIIFSHGLGGTREGYEYLGRHWASHGYLVAHLQHLGSDDSVWRGSVRPKAALQQAANSLTNAVNRPLDVRFALDSLTVLNRTNDRLRGRLNLDRVGMAGHSFGAYTTLAGIGQHTLPGRSMADPRIKAAIPMSAPVPVLITATTYTDIRVPIYHLTGTLDDSPIGNTKPADRRVPFDRITNARQLLLTLQDGDHAVFSGRPALGRNAERDRRHHELILASTAAFWDAWLKDDQAELKWLMEGGFAGALGQDGKLEQK
jgi:predicted dienelactone hydrolase